MAVKKVTINRAPVLTLWAAVVAERLGYDQASALTLGKAVAGMNAQSKGQRLGIYEEHKEEKEKKEREARKPGEEYRVPVLGRAVPVIDTDEGTRATAKGKPIDPASVKRYLEGKFGDELDDVRAAMEQLAKSFTKRELTAKAYSLYEEFRPEIPEGKKGWGAAGELNLDKIRSLAEG